MMFGFRDVFPYLECDGCGCLQLLNPPQDMGRYYPSGYSAFCTNEASSIALQRIRHSVRKRRNQGFLEDAGWLDRLLARRYDYPQLNAFAHMRATRHVRILDVGCGSGRLLLDLKDLGYQHVLGVDLFVPQPIDYGNGVRVVKARLEDLAGTTWDVIMFHHSFEHMPHPARVLRLTADLLAPGGHCLIRLPLVGWAWEHYGVNWVQLDAPRHFFLHTEKSFQLLARGEGLRVHELRYDSTEYQFWVSELYTRDVAQASVDMTRPQAMFSNSTLRRFRAQAARLNSEGRGDQAAFDLVRL
jgi:SAM-dependent methyltransferase